MLYIGSTLVGNATHVVANVLTCNTLSPKNMLQPGSRHAHELDQLVRLLSSTLLRADQGQLSPIELPPDFADQYWPELPEGEVLASNVLRLLAGTGPEGIPDPGDPRNAFATPVLQNPPGLGKVVELTKRLQEAAAAAERAERTLRTLQQQDIGLGTAEAVATETTGLELKAKAAAERCTTEAASRQQLALAALRAAEAYKAQRLALPVGSEQRERARLEQQRLFEQADRLEAEAEAAEQAREQAAQQYKAAAKQAEEARVAVAALIAQQEEELTEAVDKAASARREVQQYSELIAAAAEVQQQQASGNGPKNAIDQLFVTRGDRSMTSTSFISLITALLKWG